MVHHFAFYIHTNTDSAILTVFISTAMVSVYNVYGAVILGMERIITSISTGTAAGLGNLLVTNDEKRINQTVNIFELVQGGVATVFYTITALLLIPFVRIYSANMTDMNYIQPLFGYIFIFAEAIYCFRCIYSTISTNANKFKETQLGAILECATNIVISLLLVIVAELGILGVAIGTAIAMFVRYVFEIIFLSKNVIYRPLKNPLKMLFLSMLISLVSVLICNSIMDYNCIDSAFKWVLFAIPTSLITVVVAAVGYTCCYKSVVKKLLHKILKRGAE